MGEFLTEVAIQLKGSLSFLLGLGGMFTVVKSALTGLLLLPKEQHRRPALKAEFKALQTRLIAIAGISAVLFVVALILYFFGPITTIDPEGLKTSGDLLTIPQRWAVGALLIMALALVVCDGLSSVWRHRIGIVAASP